MSLIARHLEANGISSVVLGSALGIVERCGVARFAFVGFPLGDTCGKPCDLAMQHQSVEAALALLEMATEAPTTRRLLCRWSADETWRDAGRAKQDWKPRSCHRAEVALQAPLGGEEAGRHVRCGLALRFGGGLGCRATQVD